MRKTFTGLGLGALLSAGLAISVATTAPTAAFADDTVKIGVLLIDSGPLAGLKETQVKAVNLAIEQINAAGGAAGKKLEAVFISYPGTPDTAVDGATRAVQKDGAMFITGMDTSSVSPALQAKLPALKVLMLEVMANAALRFDNAAMQEEQVRVQTVRVEQRHVVQLPGTAVDGLRYVVLCRIRMDDANSKRFACRQRQNRRQHHQERSHA